jgi:hypothetical protein
MATIAIIYSLWEEYVIRALTEKERPMAESPLQLPHSEGRPV